MPQTALYVSFQGKDVFAVYSYVVLTWLPPYDNDPRPAIPVRILSICGYVNCWSRK